MEERNSNIAPWLLLIFSVVIATVGWWFYFGEHATSTRQEQELSSIKKQYVSETAELRERLSKLENNRDKLLQSTQEIKGDFNGLENRLKRLGDKLAEANSSNKRLTEKLATASADKELLNNQLSLLRKETSLLQEELNTAEVRRTSLETEKELLGIERERYKTEAERLGNQYQELKQSLAKEKTLLTSTIETLEKQSVVLERELESAVAARDEAFNEKENLLKERNNFSAQIDELLNEITQLKSQLAAKNAAESTMKDDLKLLLNERKHLRAQLKDLGVDLEKTGSEFKRKNAALEAEKKQLSNALDELQRKLENEKMATSVAIGRCGPCCSIAAVGRMAITASGSSSANSVVRYWLQSRLIALPFQKPCHCRIHPFEMPGPALWGRAVHQIMRGKGGPKPRRAKLSQPAQQCPPPRSANPPGHQPARPTCGKNPEPGDMSQARPNGPARLGQVKRKPRHHNPVQPPFQHRRHPKPPGGIHKNQRIAPKHILGMRRDGPPVLRQILIGGQLGTAQNRIEAHGIKIRNPNLRPSALQPFKRQIPNRGGKALGPRMAIHHKRPHHSRSISEETRARNAARPA